MLSDYANLPAPDGWTDATIDDVAAVVGGGTPSTDVPDYWHGQIPWATPGDITSLRSRTIERTETYITETGLKASTASLLPVGSLLLTSRATIGACAINSVPMATNQGFASLVCKNGMNVDFLYYLLSNRSQDLSAKASGSTFVELAKSELRKLRVLRPPVREQRVIADTLGSVDDAIDSTREVIEQTLKLKSALLHDLLTNGLPSRHKKYSNNKNIGRYPADWKLIPLNDLIDDGRPICYGILMPGRGYPGGVPVVKVKDIRGGQIDESDILLTSPELDEEYRRSRLRAGDLLVTIRGSTGRVAIVPAILDRANITQDTARLSVSDHVTRDYLYYALQGHALQQRIQHHTIGQAVKGINIEEVRKLPIPMPAQAERAQIVELFHCVEVRMSTEGALLTRLTAAKSALSQALLTGRVRVPLKGGK